MKIRTRFIAVLLGLCAVNSAGLAQRANAPDEVKPLTHAKKWQTLLSALTRDGDVRVIFDLPEYIEPPSPPDSLQERSRLEAIAYLSSGELIEVPEAYVVRRVPFAFASSQSQLEIASWLQSLDSKDPTEGLKMRPGDIPQEIRLALARTARLLPEEQAALFSPEKHASVHVRLSLGVEFEDPKSGRKRTSRIDPEPTQHNVPIRDAASGSASVGQLPIPFARHRTGSLVFGAGEVMTAGALLQKANSAFGTAIVVDERLLDHHVFVAGTYDKEAMLNALKELFDPIQPLDSNDRKALAALTSNLANRLLATLREPERTSFSTALGMKSVTMQDLVSFFGQTKVDQMAQRYGSLNSVAFTAFPYIQIDMQLGSIKTDRVPGHPGASLSLGSTVWLSGQSR